MIPYDPLSPLTPPESRETSDPELVLLTAYETVFTLGNAVSVNHILTDLARHAKLNRTVREDLDFVEGQRDVVRYMLRLMQDVAEGKHRRQAPREGAAECLIQ